MSTGPVAESLELIALSHGVNVEFLRDGYDQIRGMLGNGLGELALDAVSASEAAIANRDFLEDCVGVLPGIDDNSKFHVSSQADIRWLQASVIRMDYPYYIIGEAQKGPATELLLHKVSGGGLWQPSHSLAIAKMSTRKYQKLREPFQARLQKPEPLSPREMNRLFDRESRQFVLDELFSSPDDSMHAAWASQGVDPINWLARLFEKGPGIKVQEHVSSAVYSETLTELNVANRLSYLVLAFGKEAEMTEVIKKYLPGSPASDE